MSFPTLLSPLVRGRLHLKNRVDFPGHQTLFSDGGVIGDRMLAYYLERARGGAAASIVEGAAVHETTIKFPSYLLAYDEAIVPSPTDSPTRCTSTTVASSSSSLSNHRNDE